ncbi:MAG: PQQ-binding-like beta-propeller repeat protein [Gammaproteobacteria bacterium]|nr:PQQ-binding-like beta-propeller repeat protein [Gammaproteobacteria bacterium]
MTYNNNHNGILNRPLFYLIVNCCLLLLVMPVQAQQDGQSFATFTAEQASQGDQLYTEQCASCHGYRLEGFELAPSLSGNYFSRRWGDKPVTELAANLQRMPPTVAGGLGQLAYSQILAYLLQQNGVDAGATALPEQLAALGDLLIPAQELVNSRFSPAIPGYSTNGPLVPISRLNDLTPVTNAMLLNPPKDDWLIWRRTHENLGHSPLDQINRANVDELEIAWTWSLPPGANMMTPLVHDGVLFAYSFGDVVQAIDAASGDLLWSFQRELVTDAPLNAKKGVAIYEDKIIVPTSDVHLLALDAKTGKLIWDHEVDVGDETDHKFKSAPIIVNGKAIIGLTGQVAVAGGNFIVAVDLETGEEAWRFYTVARPGDIGGNSWNGLSATERTGGSVWTPGSYDADLNLLYFGPAPTYNTNLMRVPVNIPGVTSDALYTNSTIALNPDTGELIWHYQHMRNDQLDHDWAFERQIIELPINGVNRKVIVTAGKQAIFEVLDAATGEYLFSLDMDMQNVVLEIDPRTGAKTLNPAAVPQPGQVLAGLSLPGACPDALGARNMQSTSYNPGSGILYIPMQDTCVNNLTGERWQKYPDPEQDGLWGMLRAVDLESGEVVWTQRQFAPPASGNLTTDGGLLFSGSIDRWFKAVDQANGEVLWQQRLDNAPSSYPITYRVDGKQYIAVATNSGGPHGNGMERTTGIANPPSGASLWVFALKE